MWYSDLDVEVMLNSYFEKFNGPATVPMKNYYTTVDNSMQDLNGYASFSLQEVRGCKVIVPKILTPVTIEKMEQNLNFAELIAANDKIVLNRIAMISKVYEETKDVLKKTE